MKFDYCGLNLALPLSPTAKIKWKFALKPNEFPCFASSSRQSLLAKDRKGLNVDTSEIAAVSEDTGSCHTDYVLQEDHHRHEIDCNCISSAVNRITPQILYIVDASH